MTANGFSFDDGADLLTSPLALPDLSRPDALQVVHHMKLTLAKRNSVLFRAGGPRSPFMVMVMEGDAVVEGRLDLGQRTDRAAHADRGQPLRRDGRVRLDDAAHPVRGTSEVCLATLHYSALSRLTEADPVLGCALLRAALAHVTRRLRSADTWIETLNQINRSLQEEWSAEIKSDRATIARLNVLMKLERKTGLRTYLVGDSIEVAPGRVTSDSAPKVRAAPLAVAPIQGFALGVA